MNSSEKTWKAMVPVDDTALAVTDTRGSGPALVYLNGSYATQSNWRRVIDDLGATWRHVTFDERARGRSRRSADYSFEACVRDVDAIVAATGVHRPILVGWSYGAAVAAQWAARHPDRCHGVVCVDGAYPFDWINDENRARIRKLFGRMKPFLPLLRPLGLAARMSAEQHADVNIELNEVLARFRPVLESLTVPVRYVVASDDSLGASAGESAQMRATLDPVLAQNPNVRISATVTSNHGAVLRKAHREIAAAVREVAAADRQQT